MPQLPRAKLLVAGAEPDPVLLRKRLGGRISYLGYVEDLTDLYRRAALAIAPMHSGGGTRIKVLEAAAHAVPVVSTLQSAAGLVGGFGPVATTPYGFARHCKRLAFDLGTSCRVGYQARKAVMRNYDQRHILGHWRQAFRELLAGTENP